MVQAQLRKTFSTLTTSHLAFDVFAPAGNPNVTAAVIGFDSPGSQVLVGIGPGGTCRLFYWIFQGADGGYNSINCAGGIATNAWIHVDVDFSMPLDGGVASATLTIDGVPRLTNVMLGAVNETTNFHLTIAANGYSAGQLWIDNVALDGK